jgi:hypothetical protein
VKRVGDDEQPGGCWSGISQAPESLLINLYVGDVTGVVSPTFVFPANSSTPSRKHATKKVVLQGKDGASAHVNYSKLTIPGVLMSDTVLTKVTDVGAFVLLESWFESEVKKEQERATKDFGQLDFLEWIQAEAATPFDIEAAAGARAVLRDPPPVICAASKFPSGTSQFGSESQAAAARNNAASLAGSKGRKKDRKGSATPRDPASAVTSPVASTAAAAAARSAAGATDAPATDGAKAFAPPEVDRVPARTSLARRSAAAKASKVVAQKQTPAAAQVAAEAPAVDPIKILKSLGSFTAPERDAPLASWLLQLKQFAGKSATQINKMKDTDWTKIWTDMRIADPALVKWLGDHFHTLTAEEICTALKSQGWRRARGYGSKVNEFVVWWQHDGTRPSADDNVKSFAAALQAEAEVEAEVAAEAEAAAAAKSKRASTNAANEDQQGPAKRDKKANGRASRAPAAEPAAAAAASSPAANRQARANSRLQQQQQVLPVAPAPLAGQLHLIAGPAPAPATVAMEARMRQIEAANSAQVSLLQKALADSQAQMKSMLASQTAVPTSTAATSAAAAAAAFTTPPPPNNRKRTRTADSVDDEAPAVAAAAAGSGAKRVKQEPSAQVAELQKALQALQEKDQANQRTQDLQAQILQGLVMGQTQTSQSQSQQQQSSPPPNTQQMQPDVSASQQQQQQQLQQQQQQQQQQLATSLQLQPYSPPSQQTSGAQSAQLQPYFAPSNLSGFNVSPQRGIPPSALMALQMQLAMQAQQQQAQLALHQQQLFAQTHRESQQQQAQLAMQQQQQLAQAQQSNSNVFTQFMHQFGQ